MDNASSANNFFIYPQVQKQDEIHTLIARLEDFRQSLDETEQDIVGTLISHAVAHSSKSHLLPHCTHFEFVLLAMIIELQREISKKKQETADDFSHPPFP